MSAGLLLIGMYWYIMKHDMKKFMALHPQREEEQTEVKKHRKQKKGRKLPVCY